MNFDMLASPNFIPYVIFFFLFSSSSSLPTRTHTPNTTLILLCFQVHDGYQVGSTIPEETKAASRQVQVLFEDYFVSSQLPYKLNDMIGGSDFLPFIEAFVPTSGMATGASGIKSATERDDFHGFANAAFDPCYHLACDTVPNVSQEALRQISQATSTVLEKLSTMSDLRSYLGTASQ